MILSQNLIDKICTKICCGGLTSVETCQTTNALTFLCNPVFSVATYGSLPSASLYTGRMIYVNDENRYYYSTGYTWINDFSSDTSSTGTDIAWTWGTNTFGTLGDNTSIAKSSPISIVGGFTDWCYVSTHASGSHNLAIRTNGTAWAWGNATTGKLGDNTAISRSSPVSVVGGFTDWCQVSVGGVHSLGLRSNGTAWAWGTGGNAALGDGTVTNRSSPVSVVGGFTDWCCLSAANFGSVGIRTNGTIWTWGSGTAGRLGDNTVTAKCSPVSIIGGFTDWCRVSAGAVHNLAIRTNGTAWAWGCNVCGQLGEGTIASKTSPVSVIGGFTDWSNVSGGCNHSFGLRTNGTLWGWGANDFGKLGDSTVTARSSPVSVIGGFTDWCQVSAGNSHTIALRTNGTLWSWGCNVCGGLGDGTVSNKCSPVSVVGGFTEWCQVSAGDCFNIGLTKKIKGL